MDEIFDIGDVVQLNSGGPKMTITEIALDENDEGNDEATCTWFLEGVIHQTVITVLALHKASNNDH
jgi:uncharacterized protein YodC (DUF2158 family)